MINYKRTTCRKCRCFSRTNEHSRGTVMFKTKSCTFLCFFFLAELLSFSGSERGDNKIQPFEWILYTLAAYHGNKPGSRES